MSLNPISPKQMKIVETSTRRYGECSLLFREGDSCGVEARSQAVGKWRTWYEKLGSAFLPEGYPGSVTSDYLSFQTWDTLQGLSTYVRSMLSTQALLSGFGVGASSATALGATFQWFLRDLTGMLGGIIFTLYQGSNLDNRAKQWRLAADFLNDIGMLMDLVATLFPSLFITLLCLGSAARAVTGVASGATRAALTQHFARHQNSADVSAKEGSQETAATLVGMVIGMLLARMTAQSIGMMWVSFLLLTAFHMYANYRAVRSLCLTSLNSERIEIILTSFFVTGRVPSPAEASKQETLFPFPASRKKIVLGARITSLYAGKDWQSCSSVVSKYGSGKYLLHYTRGKNNVDIVLHCDSTRRDYLHAYIHALVLSNALERSSGENPDDVAGSFMQHKLERFLFLVQEAGWNANHVLLSPLEWRANWSEHDDKKTH